MKNVIFAMYPGGFPWRARLRVRRIVVKPVAAFINHRIQIMLKTGVWLLLGIVAPSMAYAAENVHTSAGFETGKFQPASGNIDAFFVQTLPDPQRGNKAIRTGKGGGGPTSNWDTKVVRSETVAGQLVMPRKGNFFARSMLYYDKDYTSLNGGGLPKPRSALSLTSDIHRFDFDDEGWLGLSIFIPRNFEDETANKGPSGAITIIVANVDSSASFFNLNIFVPAGETKAHWVFQYRVDDQNVTDENAKRIAFFGPVEPDKGMWTDFIIRYRSNPFSVDTNPADLGIRNANDQLYLANKGILQVWKSEGGIQANGDRRMVRKFSIENAPVGVVPGATQGKSLIQHSLRVYKFAWQRQSTAVKGPIWIGFDEFRYGQVAKDRTGYSDVHPSGRACTDRCPADDSPRPKPPRDLVVSP